MSPFRLETVWKTAQCAAKANGHWLPTFVLCSTKLTLDKKKEPPSRFAARRTLFQVWYHARSRAISAEQKSRTVADQTLPSADRSWSSMISHVEQRSSRLESRGWFFFLSRVVCLCPATVGSCYSPNSHDTLPPCHVTVLVYLPHMFIIYPLAERWAAWPCRSILFAPVHSFTGWLLARRTRTTNAKKTIWIPLSAIRLSRRDKNCCSNDMILFAKEAYTVERLKQRKTGGMRQDVFPEPHYWWSLKEETSYPIPSLSFLSASQSSITVCLSQKYRALFLCKSILLFKQHNM